MCYRKKASGFTLIELMIVVAVIGERRRGFRASHGTVRIHDVLAVFGMQESVVPLSLESILAPERDELGGERGGMARLVHRGYLERAWNLVAVQVMHDRIRRDLRSDAHRREDCERRERGGASSEAIHGGGESAGSIRRFKN